jgi:hypothetical protein
MSDPAGIPELDMTKFDDIFDAPEAVASGSVAPETAPVEAAAATPEPAPEAAPVAPEPPPAAAEVDIRLRALALLEAEQRAKRLAEKTAAVADKAAESPPPALDAAAFRADPVGFAQQAGLTPEQLTEIATQQAGLTPEQLIEVATQLYYAAQPTDKVPTDYKQAQLEAAQKREFEKLRAEVAATEMRAKVMSYTADLKTTVLVDDSYPLVKKQMRENPQLTMGALCELVDRISPNGSWVSPAVAIAEFERALESLSKAETKTPTAPAPAATPRATARTLTNSDVQPTTKRSRPSTSLDYAELARMIPDTPRSRR